MRPNSIGVRGSVRRDVDDLDTALARLVGDPDRIATVAGRRGADAVSRRLWRASVPQTGVPAALSMVLHRGGYPDGS